LVGRLRVTMSFVVRPSPAGVADRRRLTRSLWTVLTSSLPCLVVVLLGGIARPPTSVAVAAAGATITSQMSPRVVETQYGRLRGVLVSIADPTSTGQPARRVEVYLGLQYASLLGGRLRFMPPTGPMEKWDGVRVALKHRPVCPQPMPDLDDPALTDRERARRKRLATFVEKQQEDCLTLNVYVPARGRSEACHCSAAWCRYAPATRFENRTPAPDRHLSWTASWHYRETSLVHPGSKWLDRIRPVDKHTPADLWRCDIHRGHSGVTQRSCS